MRASKRQLLGNQAGRVPPAWREQKQNEQGSKILLSRLPPDVGELEVEECHPLLLIPLLTSDASCQQELFRKTVGPLKDVFLIYNSQGHSKGMAVVAFQRSGDAAIARTKYDGKFVDGRRPIKIEMVVDSTQAVSAPVAQTQPSLLGRLGIVATTTNTPSHDHAPNPPPSARKQRPVSSAAPAVPSRRRQKKGPRRVKKTLAQLDQEMEDYKAAAVSSFVPNGN